MQNEGAGGEQQDSRQVLDRRAGAIIGQHGTGGLGQRQWHVTANEASGRTSPREWRAFDTRQDTPPDAFRV
ncbi:hypothetical protein GCM10008965_24670 [Methylorubrum aminovorans]|nr:hypothetical protein GCM10025880_29050 [Methylorubrum aminovorans]